MKPLEVEAIENNNAIPVPRIIAVLIDGLLIALILNVTLLRPNMFPGFIDIRVFIITAVYILYEALMIFFLGATIGKRIMGIVVVDHRTLERPVIRQCLLRSWAKVFFGIGIISNTFVTFMGLLYTLLNTYKLFTDERHRAIHDIIGGTLAVRMKK